MLPTFDSTVNCAHRNPSAILCPHCLATWHGACRTDTCSPGMEKDSLHFFCGSLSLALLLGPALPHLVAAFRQDLGLAYFLPLFNTDYLLIFWFLIVSACAVRPPRMRTADSSYTSSLQLKFCGVEIYDFSLLPVQPPSTPRDADARDSVTPHPEPGPVHQVWVPIVCPFLHIIYMYIFLVSSIYDWSLSGFLFDLALCLDNENLLSQAPVWDRGGRHRRQDQDPAPPLPRRPERHQEALLQGTGERSLTAAATYRQDRRDKKLPVPAVPSKTRKRGLEMPGDVALSAVGWSPTTITDTMRPKLDCEGNCQVCEEAVPWNGDRPRPRMPSRGFSVPTTPTRCSSTPPGPTSCWRTPSRRSPTRCQTPPSSQPWWPSVSACAVRPPRMRTADSSYTSSLQLKFCGVEIYDFSLLPVQPPSTPRDADARDSVTPHPEPGPVHQVWVPIVCPFLHIIYMYIFLVSSIYDWSLSGFLFDLALCLDTYFK